MTKTVTLHTFDRAGWAQRIADSWGQALTAVLETGAALVQAKAQLKHGEFEAMIEADLPFGTSTARRLMAVAQHPELSNRAHGHVLPRSWRTLYELTKLDAPTLTAALAEGRIRPDMERPEATRLVTGDRRRARLAKAEEKARGNVPLEDLAKAGRRWVVIYADPAWPSDVYSAEGLGKAAELHYPTMTLEEIMALPVGAIAADDAALFLWATGPRLADAVDVMRAWGFTYKTRFVWDKVDPGPGRWVRDDAEILLLGTRGDLPMPVPGTQARAMHREKKTAHSRKPDHFREVIEAYFPNVSKIELNRRGAPAAGWDAWGNEAEAAATSPAAHDPEDPTDPFYIPPACRRTTFVDRSQPKEGEAP